MNKQKILFLGPKESFELVKKELMEYDLFYFSNVKDDIHHDNEYIAVIDAYMKIRFSEKILKNFKKLKVFITATTGANHIDSNFLNKKGIPLLTLKGQKDFLKNITPAAEHSWLLLQMCARKIKPVFKDVENFEWERNNHPGQMLNGKTLGIIGCGRIGGWMSRYSHAFGMQCLGFDPMISQFETTILPCELDFLLKNSDFISLHVNYATNLEKFIGEREFSLMKKGSIFINTSRGELIDENALLKALETSHLGGAGVDVLRDEQNIRNNLLLKNQHKFDNLIITPHIGGYSPDALNRVLTFTCKRLKKELKTK